MAEILAHHTGGGHAFTRAVNQRLGARVSVVGARRGWRPAAVTLAAVAVSLATSLAVAVLDRGVVVALLALVGWQAAYGLDCADGQLARVTGRTSTAGAALDLYGDWLARAALVAALLVSVDAGGWDLPMAVVAALAVGQVTGLYHQAVRTTGAVPDLPPAAWRGVVGLLRDPGLLFVLYALSLATTPRATVALLAFGAAMGGVQFAVRFVRITRRAVRA